MQVIEIDPKQNIVFAQGAIGVAGTGCDILNAPYDAKVIGDYTGLTPPFAGEAMTAGTNHSLTTAADRDYPPFSRRL